MAPTNLLPLTTSDLQTWLQSFHLASATLSTSTWLPPFFTTTATLHYANVPPLTGLSSITQFFDSVLPKLAKMEHEITYFDYVPEKKRLYQKARIVYVVKGDEESGEKGEIIIDGLAVFELVQDKSDERIKAERMEVFLDPEPVMRRIREVFGDD